ncbi:MAG: alpha-1,2-fucosyltransferase [Lachnospiraceae bacterium]|nr:alpha-1,2-fucosyltransferase [Lachnospiraceae bacterium]
MIGTELTKGQGLGNQLFCYISARCIALDNGYEFAALGMENMANNIHSDCGLYFMDLESGLKAERSDFEYTYNEMEDRLYAANSRHDLLHGVYVTGTDDKMLHPQDDTLLLGNMQDEKYFIRHKDEIKNWLRVKEEYDCKEYCDDNLCIMHIRCSDYLGNPELFLSKKYWKNGMDFMKKINPKMKFMIITNDVKEANKLLPDIPAYNFDLAKDYSILKNAKYLLLSNSSFTFFPAFTSDTVKYILAPKYWARHNVSDGYWASEQNIYTGWHYMDRKGKVFTAGECRRELEEYKAKSKKWKRLNCQPTGLRLSLMKMSVVLKRTVYWCGRILRSIKRRVLSA